MSTSWKVAPSAALSHWRGGHSPSEYTRVLDSRDDRHAYVGYIFQNLYAFIMNLAPLAGSATSPKMTNRHQYELPARAVMITILLARSWRNPVEGIYKSV